MEAAVAAEQACQRAVQEAQREVEDARAELVRLATNHFPELPRLHPDIFEVVSELKVYL